MTISRPGATFRFADFELDTRAYELTRSGRRVRLPPQPMDLLLLLLEHPRELVSREEIAARFWQAEVFVDRDAGIHSAILKIRQVLGDSHQSSRFIETVPGKGYRFVAPVAVAVTSAALPQVGWSAPAGDAAPGRRHNLPAELTSFVGRRKELTDLHPLLAASRLVSLTGGGGVGKTRLAVRLAANLLDQFPDGVWLIELASLTAPDLVAQTIATEFGVRESPGRTVRDALLDHLRARQILLVLDTCEHLLDVCAELVAALLRAAPLLRIVTTSREALGVCGEVVYRVPSLSIPAAAACRTPEALIGFEATELFIERAIATDPAFKTNDDGAMAIARICERLDGIPLAIELAAARILVLSPPEIEARLKDRFRLLTGGTRTAVARQRTLEATVDWSYQLLSDVERVLLGRLSVFSASWTLEAAEQVCAGNGVEAGEVFDLLSRLLGKSLITIESNLAGRRRYRLLETLQQYARERLVRAGDADRLRERHFEYFFQEFRGALPVLRGAGQLACLRRLRIEQENVRAALEWGLSSETLFERSVALAGALFWFWTKRGLFEEGKLWLERAVAAPALGPVRGRALMGLAHMHYFQGRLLETERVVAEALALGRQHGDSWLVSFALFFEALVKFEHGDYEPAAAVACQAREAARASGEAVQHGGPLLVLANIALLSGDEDQAQRLYDESIVVHRHAGDIWGLGILLSAAAGLRIVRNEFSQARAHASEALALCEELEDPRGLAWSLEVFAGLLAAAGHGDAAAQLWGASDSLLERVGGSLIPTIGWIRTRYVPQVKTALGDLVFARVCEQGQALSVEAAVALARRQALVLS